MSLQGHLPGYRLVQIPPPLEPDDLPGRVEGWVDHHIKVIEELNIEGPYRLLGWSFGGVVALEVARRLQDSGRDVSFAGLIDTYRPYQNPLAPGEYLWFHVGEAASFSDPADRWPYVIKKVKVLAFRSWPRLGKIVIRVLERVGLRKRYDDGALPVNRPDDPHIRAIWASFLTYECLKVDFPVTLFVTAEAASRTRSPSMGWARWMEGGFERIPIGGSHFSLFDPDHIEGLGVSLAPAIWRGEVHYRTTVVGPTVDGEVFER